jgi:ABC-type polysaccharide/polyol phosphate transport system ATPase subunit
MNAISVKNLSKRYILLKEPKDFFKAFSRCRGNGSIDIKWALKDIDLSVPKGQTCGLIGMNGSGKSTLLGLISGIIAPTAGDVKTAGRISSILELGSGFQAELTGRQNIILNAGILGLSRSAAIKNTESIIEFSELGMHIDKPVKTFSSGMMLRLGFAIAMHIDFDILLIDEILSVGDLLFKRKCFAKMRQFKGAGKTILLSSHNLADVAAFCDRIVLLEGGRIILDGPVETVLKQYWENCEKEQCRIIKDNFFSQHRNIYEKDIGDIKLTSVRFLNGSGVETNRFGTNETLTVRIGYFAHKEVNNPLFRVQFFRNDGLWVHGANTRRQNVNLGMVKGAGEIELVYDHLNLLEGDYYVTVGIWPDEYKSMISDVAYDLHEMAYIINVKSNREDGGGLVYNPFHWKFVAKEDQKNEKRFGNCVDIKDPGVEETLVTA